MTETSTGTAGEDTLARVRALQARRENNARPPRPTHAASKIIAGGAAASASLLMVAAMAVADQPGATAAPQIIERVVVIEVPVQGANAQASTAATRAEPEITVIREVRTLPAPAQDATPAPSPTEGS